MVDDVRVRVEAPLGQRLHLVDAPARRVHLGARQDVSGTSFEAQAAMDAIEEQFVIDHVADRSLRLLRSPSQASHEASGVEDSGRIEGRLEPAHQLHRARRRLVEKWHRAAQRRADR